jgi:hypothetical protein
MLNHAGDNNYSLKMVQLFIQLNTTDKNTRKV